MDCPVRFYREMDCPVRWSLATPSALESQPRAEQGSVVANPICKCRRHKAGHLQVRVAVSRRSTCVLKEAPLNKGPLGFLHWGLLSTSVPAHLPPPRHKSTNKEGLNKHDELDRTASRLAWGMLVISETQRKTKGQQLKGKIVSALFSHFFHTFLTFFTLLHTFSHFVPQGFLSKSSLFLRE